MRVGLVEGMKEADSLLATFTGDKQVGFVESCGVESIKDLRYAKPSSFSAS